MTKLLLTHAILSREENHILVDFNFMSDLIYEFLGISESPLAFLPFGNARIQIFFRVGGSEG